MRGERMPECMAARPLRKSRPHDGQVPGATRAYHVTELSDLAVEHSPVQEEQGREGLVLRGGTHLSIDCEVREERVDLGLSHFGRVAEFMEKNIPAHPVGVRHLGAGTIMAGSQGSGVPLHLFRLARLRAVESVR